MKALWEEAVDRVEEFLEENPDELPRRVRFTYREGVPGQYRGVLSLRVRVGNTVFAMITPASNEQQDMIRVMVSELVYNAA